MNIFGFNYEMKYDHSSRAMDANGRLFPDSQEVQIANNISREQTISVVLHEILEALDFHMELNLEHNKITCLETGLFQVLTSNGVDLTPLLKELGAVFEPKDQG